MMHYKAIDNQHTYTAMMTKTNASDMQRENTSETRDTTNKTRRANTADTQCRKIQSNAMPNDNKRQQTTINTIMTATTPADDSSTRHW
jgi:hypothetical protein